MLERVENTMSGLWRNIVSFSHSNTKMEVKTKGSKLQISTLCFMLPRKRLMQIHGIKETLENCSLRIKQHYVHCQSRRNSNYPCHASMLPRKRLMQKHSIKETLDHCSLSMRQQYVHCNQHGTCTQLILVNFFMQLV